MTDKERLGNLNPTIVDNQGNITLKGEDFHWLMEQAERVEELEKENRRYRKAINNIIEKAMLFGVDEQVFEDIKEANRVLDGENNER